MSNICHVSTVKLVDLKISRRHRSYYLFVWLEWEAYLKATQTAVPSTRKCPRTAVHCTEPLSKEF
jgi:hypothetical protein